MKLEGFLHYIRYEHKHLFAKYCSCINCRSVNNYICFNCKQMASAHNNSFECLFIDDFCFKPKVK